MKMKLKRKTKIKNEVTKFNWIGKQYQPADCLMKRGGESSNVLLNTLKTTSTKFFLILVYKKKTKTNKKY